MATACYIYPNSNLTLNLYSISGSNLLVVVSLTIICQIRFSNLHLLLFLILFISFFRPFTFLRRSKFACFWLFCQVGSQKKKYSGTQIFAEVLVSYPQTPNWYSVKIIWSLGDVKKWPFLGVHPQRIGRLVLGVMAVRVLIFVDICEDHRTLECLDFD